MDDPGAEPKVLTVAERFWIRQEVDNVAWIDMGGQAIVIDTLEHVEKDVGDNASRDSDPYEITPVNIPLVSGTGGQLRKHWCWDRFLGNPGRKRFTPREILADSRRERPISCVIVPNGKTASLGGADQPGG